MSLADAIAAATGLDPARDFDVRDIGDGPFLAAWFSKDVPEPTAQDLDAWTLAYEAGSASRAKLATLRSKALDYVVAIMAQQELGDDSKLIEIKADIATRIGTAPTIRDVSP